MKKLPLFSMALLSAGVLSAPASGAEDYKVLKVLESGVPEDEVWPQSVSFSPDGLTLASGGGTVLRLWDVASGEEKAGIESKLDSVYIYDEHEYGFIQSVSFSPDGRTVAFAAWIENSRYFGLWDLASGEEALPGGMPYSLLGGTLFFGGWMQSGGAPEMSFSPDGQVLAAIQEHEINLWDMTTEYTSEEAEFTTLEVPPDNDLQLLIADHLSFSPDSQTLAVVDRHHDVVRLFEVPSGAFRATLETGRSVWGPMYFSPDGETLATAGEGNTILLWDMAGGELKAVLEGHTSYVGDMSFSPDSRTLVSGSSSDSRDFIPELLLWDVPGGELKAVLEGHTHKQRILDVSFSPDGRTLASSGRDGMVLLWDMAPASTPSTPTAVQASPSLPEQTSLLANYPNPFNSRTQVAYRLARPGLVRLTVYNALGQPVRALVEEVQAAGEYRVSWDGRDQEGAGVAAGVYLTRLLHEDGAQTRRLLYLK